MFPLFVSLLPASKTSSQPRFLNVKLNPSSPFTPEIRSYVLGQTDPNGWVRLHVHAAPAVAPDAEFKLCGSFLMSAEVLSISHSFKHFFMGEVILRLHTSDPTLFQVCPMFPFLVGRFALDLALLTTSPFSQSTVMLNSYYFLPILLRFLPFFEGSNLIKGLMSDLFTPVLPLPPYSMLPSTLPPMPVPLPYELTILPTAEPSFGDLAPLPTSQPLPARVRSRSTRPRLTSRPTRSQSMPLRIEIPPPYGPMPGFINFEPNNIPLLSVPSPVEHPDPDIICETPSVTISRVKSSNSNSSFLYSHSPNVFIDQINAEMTPTPPPCSTIKVDTSDVPLDLSSLPSTSVSHSLPSPPSPAPPRLSKNLIGDKFPSVYHPVCCPQSRINLNPRYYHIKTRSPILKSFLLRTDRRCYKNHYSLGPYVPLRRFRTGLSSPPFLFN